MFPPAFVNSFAHNALLHPPRPPTLPPRNASPRSSPACTPRMTLSKRDMRRKIVQADTFNRMGFRETRDAVERDMSKQFTSGLIHELLDSANTLVRDNVTFHLAKAYGFCWGVERAVAMAYETRARFPDRRLWITNEIIHNPIVNQRLRDMDIFFVPQDGLAKDLTGIAGDDVVILPAFGATLEEMTYLDSIGAQIVDTTCPWVSKVWNVLEMHRKSKCTSIIHGKWKHEETVATASFADKYLVVLNMDEAQYVSNYILNGGDREHFLQKFTNAMSAGFDPDVDLEAVGVANQTTMLKSETTAIGKLFESTMMQKFGSAQLNEHFVAFDTICDATQERQDAMFELLGSDKKLDMMLVVGGYNSSNTSHLQEIAEHANVPSFWIERPETIEATNTIRYRTSDGADHVKENWLPSGPVSIGVTSGASTPDKVVEDALERVMMIAKLGTAQAA